jgi:hypothetical protein
MMKAVNQKRAILYTDPLRVIMPAPFIARVLIHCSSVELVPTPGSQPPPRASFLPIMQGIFPGCNVLASTKG